MLSRRIASATVFTGARDGVDPRHRTTARDLGKALAKDQITLVYGGGKVGLMGALAESAMSAGGRVVGVMPEHLVAREIAHPGLTDLHVVASMHERKQTMADLADAFIALPGGAGTLEELFEAWTWQQLGLHTKPIALIDADYWASLIAMVDHMVAEGFVRAEDRDTLIVAADAQDALAQLRAWASPTPKWR
nr:TIGR00730 family Rossman fold protein [Micrococcus luteus]